MKYSIYQKTFFLFFLHKRSFRSKKCFYPKQNRIFFLNLKKSLRFFSLFVSIENEKWFHICIGSSSHLHNLINWCSGPILATFGASVEPQKKPNFVQQQRMGSIPGNFLCQSRFLQSWWCHQQTWKQEKYFSTTKLKTLKIIYKRLYPLFN